MTEQSQRPSEQRRWHMSREISLSNVLLLCGQTVAITWWLANLGANVAALKDTTVDLKAAVAGIPASAAQTTINAARVTFLEGEVERLRARLESVQSDLQRRQK